jgi:hypothetical protein
VDSDAYVLGGLLMGGSIALAWAGWSWERRTRSAKGRLFLQSLLVGIGVYLVVIAFYGILAAHQFAGACPIILQRTDPCGILEYLSIVLTMTAIGCSPLLVVFVASFFLAALTSKRSLSRRTLVG